MNVGKEPDDSNGGFALGETPAPLCPRCMSGLEESDDALECSACDYEYEFEKTDDEEEDDIDKIGFA